MGSPNLNMKSSLFCLLAVGLASCDLLFSPGQEYVYTYSGKILTGIPQVDSTFAGMSITGQVIVQATTAHIFKLAIRDVGFSTFNEALLATLKIQLPTEGIPSFWTVMEEGIEGKCENTYQVSELPEYLIHEVEQGMIKPEL